MATVNYRHFLKDVLICSLGAYGGPEAHFGVFLDHLVTKKLYLEEEDLVELLALNSILPWPDQHADHCLGWLPNWWTTPCILHPDGLGITSCADHDCTVISLSNT